MTGSASRAGRVPRLLTPGPVLFRLQSLATQLSRPGISSHLHSHEHTYLPSSFLKSPAWNHPAFPVSCTALLVHCNLWYKETAQNLFCKTGSVPPSLEWAYQNLWLFSNLPPSTDTVILKKPNLCKYVTMYAFQGISTFIIQADPLETMCSRCGIVILSFIDIIKAQTFAVASLSSHGKAKLEQKLAPRPPASSLYSESQLCQDACLLQGDSHASSWHTSLQLLFNYIRHPCAHLQASFFQEWLRRKWELTVIDGLFHFLLTWLWSQSPF